MRKVKKNMYTLDIFSIYFVSLMVTKKRLLTKILTHLTPHRWMAEGFLLLLEGGELDDAMIDELLTFLHKVVKNMETRRDITTDLSSLYEVGLTDQQHLIDLKHKVEVLISKKKKWQAYWNK